MKGFRLADERVEAEMARQAQALEKEEWDRARGIAKPDNPVNAPMAREEWMTVMPDSSFLKDSLGPAAKRQAPGKPAAFRRYNATSKWRSCCSIRLLNIRFGLIGAAKNLPPWTRRGLTRQKSANVPSEPSSTCSCIAFCICWRTVALTFGARRLQPVARVHSGGERSSCWPSHAWRPSRCCSKRINSPECEP